MARKIKGKRVRKAKGLKNSRRMKASMPKPVGKKNKKANVKRRESRKAKQDTHAARQESTPTDMLQEAAAPAEVATDLGVADPIDAADDDPRTLDEMV